MKKVIAVEWEDIFEAKSKYGKYGNFKNSKILRLIFKKLSAPEVVNKMIKTNDIMKKPAILGALPIITDIFSRHSEENISLNDKFVRSFIGALINIVMKNNGYISGTSKSLGRDNSEIFKVGMCYKNIAIHGKKTKTTSAGSASSENGQSPKFNKDRQKYRESLWDKFNIEGRILDMFDPNCLNILTDSSNFTKKSKSTFNLPFYSSIPKQDFYFTTYQIALALLQEFPGLLEAGGISLCDMNAYDEYTFIDLIDDNLSQHCNKPESTLEMIEISSECNYSILMEYIGYEVESKKNTPIKAYRYKTEDLTLNTKITPNANYITRELSSINTDFSSIIWKNYNIYEALKKVLNTNTYLTFNQAALLISKSLIQSGELSKTSDTFDIYPFYALFLETLKRTLSGEIHDIEFKFIHTQAFIEIYYEGKDGFPFNGTTNYLPVIRLK